METSKTGLMIANSSPIEHMCENVYAITFRLVKIFSYIRGVYIPDVTW